MKIAKVALKDYAPSGDELKPLMDVFVRSESSEIELVDNRITYTRAGQVVWQTDVSAVKWWTPLVESAPVQAVAQVAASLVAAMDPVPSSHELATVRRGKIVRK